MVYAQLLAGVICPVITFFHPATTYHFSNCISKRSGATSTHSKVPYIPFIRTPFYQFIGQFNNVLPRKLPRVRLDFRWRIDMGHFRDVQVLNLRGTSFASFLGDHPLH